MAFYILDEEEYAFAKKAYDEQYADLSRRLDEAVQRKVKFAEAMSEDNKWLTLMKSVSGAAKLSQELIDESVELVKVHKDGSIELVMKYGSHSHSTVCVSTSLMRIISTVSSCGGSFKP